MHRDIIDALNQWKQSAHRKPLLLRGARQTGKTYVLKAFGAQAHQAVHYFNFESDRGLEELFTRDLNPHRIINALEVVQERRIVPNTELIIFDEIQSCAEALSSLKYFEEQANDYHVAAAGSLLGIRLAGARSFPVGKVNLFDLYPMSFGEFLDAMGRTKLRHEIDNISRLEPFVSIFHEPLIELLRQYYIVGGMPEAVKAFRSGEGLNVVREIHRDIIKAYVLDFSKHAPTTDIPKLSLIWESLPRQLARENKKFVLSAVKPSARARDLDSAISWLENVGLIHRTFAVEQARLPLAGFLDRSCFKVYALDVGLLATMSGLPIQAVVQGTRVFDDYKGAFVENFVAQHLVQGGYQPLCYWRSGRMAETDFLFQLGNSVFPLEVKAAVNPRSKSLRSFDERFHPPILFRSTLLNLRVDGRICNIPLYGIGSLERIATMTVNETQ